MENRTGKQVTSALIPYKRNGGEVFVYLQKRSEHQERHAGFLAFFGGGAEDGENPEQTLIREIQEELSYTPKNYELLGRYEFSWGVSYVFAEEVGDRFEDDVKVNEGDYGKFFTEQEVLKEEKLSDDDKVVLRDLFKKLQTN